MAPRNKHKKKKVTIQHQPVTEPPIAASSVTAPSNGTPSEILCSCQSTSDEVEPIADEEDKPLSRQQRKLLDNMIEVKKIENSIKKETIPMLQELTFFEDTKKATKNAYSKKCKQKRKEEGKQEVIPTNNRLSAIKSCGEATGNYYSIFYYDFDNELDEKTKIQKSKKRTNDQSQARYKARSLLLRRLEGPGYHNSLVIPSLPIEDMYHLLSNFKNPSFHAMLANDGMQYIDNSKNAKYYMYDWSEDKGRQLVQDNYDNNLLLSWTFRMFLENLGIKLIECLCRELNKDHLDIL